MKRFFALVLMLTAIIAISSCVTVTAPTPATTQTQLNMTVVEVESFYTYSQVVKKGDTAWDIAEVFYGSGFDWKRIVELNPFLQEEGRIKVIDGKTILYIHPGEKLRLTPDVEKVILIGITTNPTQLPVTVTDTTVPWWGWLLYIGLGVLAVGSIIYLLTKGNMGRNCATTLRIGRGGTLSRAISERNAAGNRDLANRFLGTTEGLISSGEFGSCRVRISDEEIDLDLRRHEKKTSEQ